MAWRFKIEISVRIPFVVSYRALAPVFEFNAFAPVMTDAPLAPVVECIAAVGP